MKITERHIQQAIYKKCLSDQHIYMVPNYMNLFMWECDMLSVTKAGMIHEFEIKLNKADFKADFKKIEKHDALKKGENKNKWIDSYIERAADPKNEIHKEDFLERARTIKQFHPMPHYFWYVIHGFDLKPEEVPEYAGLIKMEDYKPSAWQLQNVEGYNEFKPHELMHAKTIVSAPRNNKGTKITPEQIHKILEAMSYRFCNMNAKFLDK